MHSREKDKVVNGNTLKTEIFIYLLSTNAKLGRTKVSMENARKLFWSSGCNLTLLIEEKKAINGKLLCLTTRTFSNFKITF